MSFQDEIKARRIFARWRDASEAHHGSAEEEKGPQITQILADFYGWVYAGVSKRAFVNCAL